MSTPYVPHLPLELVLSIVLYSDRETLVAFTKVSRACKLAADKQLSRNVTLDSGQLARLLKEFIGDLEMSGDEDEFIIDERTPRPDEKVVQRLKSIETLELVWYRSGLPLDLVWEAATLSSRCRKQQKLIVSSDQLYDGQPLFPNVEHLTMTMLQDTGTSSGRWRAYQRAPVPLVFGSIDMCYKGNETERESLLCNFRASEWRSISVHLPSIAMFSRNPHYPVRWGSFTFYDTRPDVNFPHIRRLEAVSGSEINYCVLGPTKWKEGWLAYAAKWNWYPSPANKVQLEWHDTPDDPACPTCAVCGA